MNLRLGISIMVACALISCNTTSTMLGGAAGGLLGSQIGNGNKTTTIIAGTIIGSLIGSEIGKHLNKEDQEKLEKSTKETLATNETTTWENENTGNKGTTRIVKSEKEEVEDNCKTFEQIIELSDGTVEKKFVKVCKDENGDWVVQ